MLTVSILSLRISIFFLALLTLCQVAVDRLCFLLFIKPGLFFFLLLAKDLLPVTLNFHLEPRLFLRKLSFMILSPPLL